MLTMEPTPEMIGEWQRLFRAYRGKLRPNRKSGSQLDAYFRSRYPYEVLEDADFAACVLANVLDNAHSREKLTAPPQIVTYRTGEVMVGIDLTSGFFHVEAEDIAQVIAIHDDLFVYLGLDEADLTNYFLVAEFVRLTGMSGEPG